MATPIHSLPANDRSAHLIATLFCIAETDLRRRCGNFNTCSSDLKLRMHAIRMSADDMHFYSRMACLRCMQAGLCACVVCRKWRDITVWELPLHTLWRNVVLASGGEMVLSHESLQSLLQ